MFQNQGVLLLYSQPHHEPSASLSLSLELEGKEILLSCVPIPRGAGWGPELPTSPATKLLLVWWEREVLGVGELSVIVGRVGGYLSIYKPDCI